MNKVQVSSKRAVVFQVVTGLLSLMISGRLMFTDTNIFYQSIALCGFLFSLYKSMIMIMYAQWRSHRGWDTEVDLPE
jgi:hypothetical protein